ncbi:MAG: helix-turn-helix domain-containing protein [Halodesulfurarchaeum sp.]|nr:helix-turn-helix domain-containing protein [Halodesulfurarchaeum sp.]
MAEDNEYEPPENVIPDKYRADIDDDKFYDEDLHPPDWLTELDYEIVDLLASPDLMLGPSVIAKNIDRSRGAVSRRLNTLEAGGIVKKVERGYYQLTDEGKARMIEKVSNEIADNPIRDRSENWYQFKVPSADEAEKMEWE